MKVSIVTAVYNGEETLLQTMKSVLAQTVKPCEYILIDGASTDGTLSVVKSIEPEFFEAGITLRVVSERDNGIYDAMNKGIAMATGDIIGMINADDWYEPTAVETVLSAYEETPFDLFYADLMMHKENGFTFVKKARNRHYATSRDWNHPTTFITKEMYGKYTYRNETIHDDYDLILRMKKDKVRISIRNTVLAHFRMNGVSHERSFKGAMKRAGIKYKIYRQNHYSPIYAVECYGVELAKLIIG